MRKLITASCAALMLASAAAPAIAGEDDIDRRHPRGERGESAYELGCAIMWMLGYAVCQELDGAPEPGPREKERKN